MKLAIISDIHSNLHSLKIAMNDAKKEKVDFFIFLGDYITDGEYGNEVLNIIKEEKKKCVILGNREKYILNYNPKRRKYNNYKTIAYTYHSLSKENLNYLKTLEEYNLININGKKILLIHGDKQINQADNFDSALELILSEFDFDICLFGHTHEYLYKKYKEKIFLNPGSIGSSADTPTYKYCIMEILDTINITLREFNVNETFERFQKNYKETNYYKENYVWGNLILKSIKESKDHCVQFLEIFNEKIKLLGNIEASKFNEIWNQTYEEYRKDGLKD